MSTYEEQGIPLQGAGRGNCCDGLGWTEVCIRRNVPSCQEKRRFIVLGKIIDIFKNRLQKYCDSSGRYRIFVAIPCISRPEIRE